MFSLKPTDLCRYCESPGEFACGRCFDMYCSPRCQKLDWSRHRYVCSSFPSLISVKSVEDSAVSSVVRIPSNPIDAVDSASKQPTEKHAPTAAAAKPQVPQEPEKVATLSDVVAHLSLNEKLPSFKKSEEIASIESALEKLDADKAPKEVKSLASRFDRFSANVRSGPREKLEISRPSDSKANGSRAPRAEKCWKEYFPFPNDGETFFTVVVVCINRKGEPAIYAMCEEYAAEFEEVTMALESSYRRMRPMEFANISMGYLVLCSYKNFVCRAEIIGKDEDAQAVRVRLIDRGNEFMVNDCSTLRPATDVAYSKKRYAFKAKIENLEESVVVGDKIEIRLDGSQADASRAYKGVMKVKETAALEPVPSSTAVHPKEEIAADPPKPVSTKSKLELKIGGIKSAVPKKKRILVSDVLTIMLPIGRKFKAKFTDLSLFMETQFGSLYERTPENIKFYETIQDKIQKCVEEGNLQDGPAYVPELEELILAKYDDEFYRAICLDKIAADKFKIQYIDFGNDAEASSAEIRELPASLTDPLVAHTCLIKVKSIDELTDEQLQIIQSDEVEISHSEIDEEKECIVVTVAGLD